MSSTVRTVILTGTHQSPIVELIRLLEQDVEYKWEIVFVGRKYTAPNSRIITTEYDLMQKQNIKFISINSIKYDRRSILNTLLGIPYFFTSLISSFQILSQLHPNLIISTGGYIAVPILIIGKLLNIPSITHEQTLTESLSTKLSKNFVTKIALSFDNPNQKQNLPQSKTVVTGNLLRQQIFESKKNKIPPEWFQQKKPLLFILGGNQGSTFINKLILKLLSGLTKQYNIIHQTGKIDYPNIYAATTLYEGKYHCIDYIDVELMASILQKASLIISRSGANISQEIVALNKKAILIPLPKSQQNEQGLNAEWTKQQLPNQIMILIEENTNSQNLLTAINALSEVKVVPKKTANTQGNNQFLKLIHETVR